MNERYEKLREERLAKASENYRNLLAAIPPLPMIGVDGLRGGMEMMLSERPSTPGIAIRDVEIPGPHGPVPTRIYTPEQHSGQSLGVYVHTHAGGFVAGGGRSTWDWQNTMFAARVPCIVVAPDFRLPPEHRFPIGLEDCWAVLKWVEAQGAVQGWDSTRIAIGGGCSGGNFAAVLALMARDAGGPKISLQVLESWVADANASTGSQEEFAEGYGLRHSDNLWVVEQYISKPEDRNDWRVSPLLVKSVDGVAPALITVGEWDILRDEDRAYAKRLEAAGVKVDAHVMPLMGHFPDPDNPEPLHRLQIDRLAETIGPQSK